MIWNDEKGQIKLTEPGAWIDLMDEVREISGLKEEDLIDIDKKPLSMANIDTLCLAIFTEYVGGPSPKDLGD